MAFFPRLLLLLGAALLLLFLADITGAPHVAPDASPEGEGVMVFGDENSSSDPKYLTRKERRLDDRAGMIVKQTSPPIPPPLPPTASKTSSLPFPPPPSKHLEGVGNERDRKIKTQEDANNDDSGDGARARRLSLMDMIAACVNKALDNGDCDCPVPEVKHGIITEDDTYLSGKRNGELKCNEGHETPAGSSSAYAKCVRSAWLVEERGRLYLPSCPPVYLSEGDRPSPAVHSSVLSSGRIEKRGAQTRSRKTTSTTPVISTVTDDTASTAPPVACDDLPPLILNARHRVTNATHGFTTCLPGFVSTSGGKMNFTCKGGAWKYLGFSIDAPPHCHNLTACSSADLPQLQNGTVRIVHGSVKGRCDANYRLKSGSQVTEYLCRNDTWILPPKDSKGCQPFCRDKRTNNGTCSGPNTCKRRASVAGKTHQTRARSARDISGISSWVTRPGIAHTRFASSSAAASRILVTSSPVTSPPDLDTS